MAVDGGYVRGGIHADLVLPLAENQFIDIKNAPDNDLYREGFIKFDLSKLENTKINFAHLVLGFNSIASESRFDIYEVPQNWSSDTLTYNNSPKGKVIVSDVNFSKMVDIAKPIENAISRGDTAFCIRIVPTIQSGAGQTRIKYTATDIPYIAVYDSKPNKNYFEILSGESATDREIWKWAQKMFDEWYVRFKNLPKPNEKATFIKSDESQYTKISYFAQHSTNYELKQIAHHPTRPLEGITDLDEYVSEEIKNAKLDKFGGIMSEKLKQKSTGYFYTTKIDGRWWIIDPLGYPYINIGLSHIDYSLNGSSLQKENALKKYGSFDNWGIETTKIVKDDLNFNSSFTPRPEVIKVKDGLPYMKHFGAMSGFGAYKKLRIYGTGSTLFNENNTMPVFDPEFGDFVNTLVKEKTSEHLNDPWVIGYTSDNELPMNPDMLDRYLTVNPSREANYYTYSCAWTWLKNITGKENPSIDDITDELRDLFRGFVWDRYFNVVATAFKAADPNHMYMGTRFLTVSKDSEWVYRFSAQYLDCMTINWYFTWEPQIEALYGIERNGDMPFMVTEFYTKAGDSGLGNTSGAGLYVPTQRDRADFYETFTIKLLESRNCIGWQLFHYMDNDPGSGTSDKSSVNANKGIINNNYELYTDFTDRIAVLNKNVYKLVDYFQNKK